MSCSFTPDAAPLKFPRDGHSAPMRACVRADERETRGVEASRREVTEDADVGEIPFGKSLERRRSHKRTRQPTPARLPLVPRHGRALLLIARARIRNAGSQVERFRRDRPARSTGAMLSRGRPRANPRCVITSRRSCGSSACALRGLCACIRTSSLYRADVPLRSRVKVSFAATCAERSREIRAPPNALELSNSRLLGGTFSGNGIGSRRKESSLAPSRDDFPVAPFYSLTHRRGVRHARDDIGLGRWIR